MTCAIYNACNHYVNLLCITALLSGLVLCRDKATVLKYGPFDSSGDDIYRPIRLQVHLDVDKVLTDVASRELFYSIVTEAKSYVENFLRVAPVSGDIILKRDPEKYCRDYLSLTSEKCHETKLIQDKEDCDIEGFEIPSEHLGPILEWSDETTSQTKVPSGSGVNGTDIVLYVSIKAISHCLLRQPVLAFASVCKRDQHGRPIASLINVCPREFEITTKEKLEITMIHELLHALGFIGKSIADFRSCTIVSRQLECSKTYPSTSSEEFPDDALEENYGYYWLRSPHVAEAAKSHYGCQDTYFGASYAVFHHTGPYLLAMDPMTVAFFKDTGWYQVNESVTEDYLWGRNQGCDFAYNCNSPDNWNSRFYCNYRQENGCHYLHLNKAKCNRTEIGSQCRWYNPVPDGECFISSERSDYIGEEYCADCRCFLSSLSDDLDMADNVTKDTVTMGAVPVCFRRRCSSDGELEIKLFDSWLKCPPDQNITVEGYKGTIQCPPSDVLCTKRDLIAVMAIPETSTPLTTVPPTSTSQMTTNVFTSTKEGTTVCGPKDCTSAATNCNITFNSIIHYCLLSLIVSYGAWIRNLFCLS